MRAWLSDVLLQIVRVLYDGGLFILVGFAIAGVIHVLLDPDRVVRRLGGRNLRSAVIAALFGAPLPLCSCGVLPTALALRRKGASREATLSFLITTPETGVDSIAVTWAFFGPVMAVIRPLVAIATGIAAAVVSLRRPATESDEEPVDPAAPDPTPCGDGCGEGGSVAAADGCAEPHAPPPASEADSRWRRAARYAFVELFDDLGFWLVFAIVLTGLLSALLPAQSFAWLAPGSLLSMLVMVAVGVPLYVCASASTPLAALFVSKGASAGAALVFLLVGPATNAATIGAISRLLGRSFLRIYLGAIIGVALVAGLALDLLAPGLGREVMLGGSRDGALTSLAKAAGGLVLAILLVASLRRTGLRPGLRELAGNARSSLGWLASLRLGPFLESRLVQGALLLWLLAQFVPGLTAVAPGHVALHQRFGRLLGAPLAPGLAYAWPIADSITPVRVDEVRAATVGYRVVAGSLARTPVLEESIVVTGDENVIDLRTEVQYRVADAARVRLGIEDAEAMLARFARARLVEAMAGRAIDRIYTDARREVEAALLAGVRADTESVGLGLAVLAVRLLDVHAPTAVHDAFRDVASAHEDRITTQHRAREYAVGVVALARGEAERSIAEAQAQAATRVAAAAGAAAAFRALAGEHRRAPEALEQRLQIESAERVLPGVRKIVRPTRGPNPGLELWARDAATPFPPPSSNDDREAGASQTPAAGARPPGRSGS